MVIWREKIFSGWQKEKLQNNEICFCNIILYSLNRRHIRDHVPIPLTSAFLLSVVLYASLFFYFFTQRTRVQQILVFWRVYDAGMVVHRTSEEWRLCTERKQIVDLICVSPLLVLEHKLYFCLLALEYKLY